MKVKKKILIASILLSLTAIVLVCSFVGCQERPATTLQQPADESNERPTIADDCEKPDSAFLVTAKPETEPSQKQWDVSEAESEIQSQQVVVKSDEKKYVEESIKSEISETPLPEVTYVPADPQDVKLSLKPESERRSNFSMARGPVSTEEKLSEDGMVAGKSAGTYEWRERDGDRYGVTSRERGLGGMGGYGRQPGLSSLTGRHSSLRTFYKARPSQRAPVRQMSQRMRFG